MRLLRTGREANQGTRMAEVVAKGSTWSIRPRPPHARGCRGPSDALVRNRFFGRGSTSMRGLQPRMDEPLGVNRGALFDGANFRSTPAVGFSQFADYRPLDCEDRSDASLHASRHVHTTVALSRTLFAPAPAKRLPGVGRLRH